MCFPLESFQRETVNEIILHSAVTLLVNNCSDVCEIEMVADLDFQVMICV